MKDNFERYTYEHENFEKEEKIIAYIALKGCAWASDIARGLLIDNEETNKLLARLVHRKDITVVTPFERFTPPEIIMTRANDLGIEAANSITPENWAKKSFFKLTEEGFHKWRIRHKGEGLRAHKVYIQEFNLSLN